MSKSLQIPPDIASCIVQHASTAEPSFSVLVRLSHINSDFADCCCSAICACIRLVMGAFMDNTITDALFEVVDKLCALIVGSVTLAVIEPMFFLDHPPENIDIMTLCGTMLQWEAWCEDQCLTGRMWKTMSHWSI